MYNIHKLECQIHQCAVQPGVPISIDPKCNCCHQPSSKLNFQFCFSLTDTFYLGSGIALFFRFIILTLFVVLLPMLTYSIVNIIANIKSDNSLHTQFSKSLVFQLSNINSIYSYNQLYSYILAGTTIIVYLLIPISIKINLKILDKLYNPQNKYFYPQILSLLFKLQKITNYTQQYIIKTLNQWYEVQMKLLKKQIQQKIDIVQKIYFHFNIEFYQSIMKEMQELQKNRDGGNQHIYPFEITNKQIKGKDSKRSYQSVKSMISKMSKLQSLKQQIKSKQLQKTNKFIVIFKKLEYLQTIKLSQQRKCGKNINKLIFQGGNYAKIYDAPFPSQINYKIQHITYKQKRNKRLISWLVTIIIIAIGSVAQYLVIFLFFKYGTSQLISYGSIIIAFLIYIISEICNKFISLIVSIEQQPNKNQQNQSHNRHIMVSNIFLKLISFNLSYFIQSIPIYQTNGLIETITFLMIIWPIFMIVGRIINFNTISSCFKRTFLDRKIQKQSINQKQANKLFEKAQNNIYHQYSQLISLILISFIYASLIPISLVTSTICILFTLIIQRIAFVYIYKQPSPSNHSLFIVMSTWLWISCIGLIIGHLYYFYICSLLNIVINSILLIILFTELALFLIIILVTYFQYRFSLNYSLSYQMIKDNIINCYSDFNQVYFHKVVPQVQVPKSAMRLTKKSATLVQQLNTISKSLQTSLRQRLFQPKNPVITAFENRQQESIEFQFDQKVQMPQKKVQKKKVPPFRHSRTNLIFKRSPDKKQTKPKDNLIKLTTLAKQEEQIEVKNRIKQAIKISIDKIN